LKSLDLYRNDVTQIEEYRDKVFELLPSLSYLDGADRNGKECASSSDLDDDDAKDLNGKDEAEDDEDDDVDDEEDEDDDENDNDVEGRYIFIWFFNFVETYLQF